jgi:hypothetical protein
MKRYKFQALVTLDPSATGTAVRAGQPRRMVVRGEHHETHGRQLFSALVAPASEHSPRPGDDHVIMTVTLACSDPGEYFGIGDHFALELGGDIGHGVVTRRLFV